MFCGETEPIARFQLARDLEHCVVVPDELRSEILARKADSPPVSELELVQVREVPARERRVDGVSELRDALLLRYYRRAVPPPSLMDRRPLGFAAAGALVIAFSAILVALADVSPSTAAVFRCAYALPVLGTLAVIERRRYGPRTSRERSIALLAGVFFAADLTFWHHSIDAVGAGLATVLANVQLVLVGVIAWAALGERPDSRSVQAVPVVLFGVVLISGALGSGAYGDDPLLGTLFGLITALTYAIFLLLLRRAGADALRPAGPLFDATLSSAVFAAVAGLAVGDIDFLPDLEAQAWLVTLALSSQVLGWLLISVSLPRLPALLTAITLTLQPVGSVLLGVALLSEDPSGVQLAGVAIVITGIVLATARSRSGPTDEPARSLA